MGGEVDDRDVAAIADLGGRLYPIHLPLQLDVHQHHVGAQVAGGLNRLWPRGDDAQNLVVQLLQAADALGDDDLVLNDQHARFVHPSQLLCPSIRASHPIGSM
jgi:hypothetical protein